MAKDEHYCEHCDDYVSHKTNEHEFDLPEDHDVFTTALWNKAGPNPDYAPHQAARAVHPVNTSRRTPLKLVDGPDVHWSSGPPNH
jgi:hypothetical protein